MPRPPRNCPSGYIFHVLNRANSRNQIFNTKFDYESFLAVVKEAQEIYPVHILAYCIMPNHWHFLLCATKDNELSKFVGWISNTHTRRYRIINKNWGEGPLYQGRFKSFPVKNDDHCCIVKRYIERNPLRANLVIKAEDWRWSSLTADNFLELVDSALDRDEWIDIINQPQSLKELQALKECIKKGKPFGDNEWSIQTATQLDLLCSLKNVGRPKIGIVKKGADPIIAKNMQT